ncbi:MAG: DUF4384 domain-containing protein [Burkholderiaceae bacterium]|nr:DUF4384 domain-containing protein [Burkholderiaceae bacterium]
MPAPAQAEAADGVEGQSLQAGYRLHEFEVQSRLGQGGFCIVYKAFDHQLKRVVALKEYMPSGMARRAGNLEVLPQSPRFQEVFDIGLNSFVKEGVTLAKFDHPALVRVYRTFQANGTAYMVMQLVQGATLEHVARALPAPPDEAWLLKLLDPLTAALQVVHDERIVHRDIAPDNVMILEGSKQPLLLDFGAARQVIGDGDQAPTAMLKPSYAPVEQYPDSGHSQGAWTDIYALAGVVHRLVTGKAPPNSQSRILKDAYVPLAERLAGKYSDRFLKAVDHALALRPEQRTQSIAAFRQELGIDDRARQLPTAAEAAAPGKRPAVALWAAAGVVVLGLGGFGLYQWLSEPSLPARSDAAQAAAATAPAAAPSALPPVVIPAPAVVAPPVAAAPSAIDPAREFDRLLQQQSPAAQVSLTLARPAIRIGKDPLQMQLSSAQNGFFYVLIHDTDGQVRLLFPNSVDSDNRIAAGKAVALPPRVTDPKTGLSKSADLVFGEPAGPARLLAIVSAQALDYAMATKSQDGDYRLLLQGQEAAAVQATSPDRSLYLGRLQCEPGKACPDAYGAAAASFTVTP